MSEAVLQFVRLLLKLALRLPDCLKVRQGLGLLRQLGLIGLEVFGRDALSIGFLLFDFDFSSHFALHLFGVALLVERKFGQRLFCGYLLLEQLGVLVLLCGSTRCGDFVFLFKTVCLLLGLELLHLLSELLLQLHLPELLLRTLSPLDFFCEFDLVLEVLLLDALQLAHPNQLRLVAGQCFAHGQLKLVAALGRLLHRGVRHAQLSASRWQVL